MGSPVWTATGSISASHGLPDSDNGRSSGYSNHTSRLPETKVRWPVRRTSPEARLRLTLTFIAVPRPSLSLGPGPSGHASHLGQLLGHLDYLDEAIATLSGEIATVITPFTEQLTRLDSIPGINRRTAEVIIAEVGGGHERLSECEPSGQLGGTLPREQRERRQAQIQGGPGRATGGCGRR
jgi:transposase